MSVSNRNTRLLLATAIAAITASGSHAEETVLKKVEVRDVVESPLGLKRASTAGSRLEITPLQTPASVDVIRSETIQDRGQFSIAEAVAQNAVGITSVAPAIFGSVYAARGFTENTSVMQLYDGTRQYIGVGNITFPFDAWTAERIEVLHGPASVLYGEGAIGGVVNVVPKRPFSGEIRNEIKLSAGSDDTYGVALDSGGALSDTVSYRVAGSGRDSKGWVDYGDNSSKTFAGSLQWRPLDDLTFTLSTDYGDQQPMAYFGTPLVNGHLLESLRGENYNVKDYKIQFKDSWNQFKTEWSPSDQIELRNTVYLVHSNREWRNAEVYNWNEQTNLIDRDDYGNLVQSQNQLGDRFDATVKSQLFGLDNSTVLGFDVNSADFGYATRFSSPTSGGSVPIKHFDHGYFDSPMAIKKYSSELKQYSLFAEDSLALSSQWTAIAGVRYDHIDIERDDRLDASDNIDTTFETASWRLGTVYNLTETTAIYAQFSTATDPVNSLLTLDVSDEQFDLATGKQWEVGVKQSFAQGRGEWTVAVFDIEKKKLLVRNPDDYTIVDQIGRQASRGIEVALGMELATDLHFEANATWLDAEYKKFNSVVFNEEDFTISVVSYAGNVPAGVPERNANAWLTWDFMPRWTTRVGVQYVGKAYQDYANDGVRDAYTITNANLSWQPVDSTTLTLQARNLFDRVYAENWHGANQHYFGQPRTLEVSARMKF